MICNYTNTIDLCSNKYSYSFINVIPSGITVIANKSETAPVLRTDKSTLETKIISPSSNNLIPTCDINDNNEDTTDWECYIIYRYLASGIISDPPLQTFKDAQTELINSSYSATLEDGILVTINSKNIILGSSMNDQIAYKSILSYAQALYDDDTDASMPPFTDKSGQIYNLSYSDLIVVFKTYFEKVILYKNLKDTLINQCSNSSTIDDIQQLNWSKIKPITGSLIDTKIVTTVDKPIVQSCIVIDTNNPEAEDIECEQDSGTISGNVAECASVSNIATITNNYSTPALLEASGGINDDLLINGSIYEPGQYPFSWSSYGSPCGSDNTTNGSHSWSYSVILAPGESITFGCKDNGFGGGFYGNSSWTLKTCF